MAKHAGPRLSPIVKILAPMLNSLYDSQRVTTTAFFAEVGLCGNREGAASGALPEPEQVVGCKGCRWKVSIRDGSYKHCCAKFLVLMTVELD